MAVSSDIFFCAICMKPFAKEISRNRHVQYCQKRDRRQHSRQKACSACNKAKIKCDFGYPCSRCMMKELACVYDSLIGPGHYRVSGRPVERSHYSKSNAPQPATVPIASFASWDIREDSMNTDIGLDFDQDESEIRDIFHTSDLLSQTAEMLYINDAMAAKTNNPNTLCSPLESFQQNVNLGTQLSLDNSQYGNLRHHAGEGSRSQFTWNSTVSSSMIPSATHINGKTVMSNSLQRALPISRNQIVLISSILCTYPRMILRRTTLPPFIHTVSYSQSDTTINNGFPEPLEICTSIAYMFVARANEPSRFLWRTIDTERQRLTKEMHLFSREETLAAIQAMVMYVIMRMADRGATGDDTELDMYTLGKLLGRFRQHCPGPFSTNHFEDGRPSWQQWIFEETRRRIANVCFLVSLVVSSCTAIPDFRSIPLCCNKALWETSNQTTWEEEYNISLGNLREGQLRNLGDLMNTQRIAADELPGNMNALDEWNSGLDGLGMLLTIATAPL